MDLKQTKLSRSEWNSIEVPVTSDERNVLQLIIDGYDNVRIFRNTHKSLSTYMKIESTPVLVDYLYNQYFKSDIQTIIDSYLDKGVSVAGLDKFLKHVKPTIKISTSDTIRISKNTPSELKLNNLVYEYVLLMHIKQLLRNHKKSRKQGISRETRHNYITTHTYHYFTLYKLLQNRVLNLNQHIVNLCELFINHFEPTISHQLIIKNAVEFIEQNANILAYEDSTLYSHQKELFTICKTPGPKLILYTAPTGTGKTITPISLAAAGHRVIFLSAGKHVGLALAKAAISMNCKIAFAFGCENADDIRLHYFSAKDYTIHRKTGGIFKVDNSVGDLVEIMICDIQSYLIAMYYMRSFSPQTVDESGHLHIEDDLIMYWDEPTITMDYETHEHHDLIHSIWVNNVVSTVILSSATLPKIHEITDTISDFKVKFSGAEIFSIVSHDSKKTIPVINRDGYAVLPHHLNENYEDLQKMCNHCAEYLTILRYMDLTEVIAFITYALKHDLVGTRLGLGRVFTCLGDISMESIKMYYIHILQQLPKESWSEVYFHFISHRTLHICKNNTINEKGQVVKPLSKTNSVGPERVNNTKLSGEALRRVTSEHPHPVASTQTSNPGLYITTKDAFTLTDGPTMFITDNIRQISKFYIKQSNIPSSVMDLIMAKIEHNDLVNDKIARLSLLLDEAVKQCDIGVSGTSSCANKINRDAKEDTQTPVSKLTQEINALSGTIKPALLNETFIPNKQLHKDKWARNVDTTTSFTSDIDEHTVREIMMLPEIESSWKILLMMGIGVFTQHNTIAYTEIMKRLTNAQRLFMIIASSDYIYGTSYQFCQLYIGKDLELTQEKLIQALGRIGRKNVQQKYSVRFRNNDHIMMLFSPNANKPEVNNMNKLFNA
jgi:hypothetical protein